jgi:hypothetical protein
MNNLAMEASDEDEIQGFRDAVERLQIAEDSESTVSYLNDI